LNNSNGVIHLQLPPRALSAAPPPTFSAAAPFVGATPKFISRTHTAAFDRRAQTDKTQNKQKK
jgi:hypothetical protein